MNVLYDISTLAMHRGSAGFTGIGRTVYELAVRLRRTPDARVRFGVTTLPRLYADAAAVVAADPSLAGIEVVQPTLLGQPGVGALARLAGVSSGIGDRGEPPAAGAVSRLARMAAFRALRLLEEHANVVGPAEVGHADVYHTPSLPVPPSLRRRFPRVRRFLTVHDLIALRRPEWFAGGTPRRMRALIRSIRPDDWVLAVSESTRRDLLEERPDLDPTRVRVTYWAAGPQFRPCDDPAALAAVRAKHGLPPDGRYLLTLNTLEPRKNMDSVVRAFGRLAEEPGLADVRLVLAGGKGWKIGPLLALIDGLPAGVRDRVVCTGFVPDADLPALYAGASAFAYPSHYEGFGLPLLEAMACGTPVVTADNSSLPEVAGDAGLAVASTDVDALADALRRVLTDEPLRADLARRALARAATFSWERCLADTLAAYRAAVDGSRS